MIFPYSLFSQENLAQKTRIDTQAGRLSGLVGNEEAVRPEYRVHGVDGYLQAATGQMADWEKRINKSDPGFHFLRMPESMSPESTRTPHSDATLVSQVSSCRVGH